VRDWWNEHPYLLSWFLLAVAMVAIVLVASRDVPLLPMQRFWLVMATVGLAGLCVWIISWEDEPLDGESDPPA
jgi:predicted tellurium resistance membrane protein TerC